MNYEKFKNQLLKDLKKKNKSCIKTIKENEFLINSYLGRGGNQLTIELLVSEINYIILQQKNQSKLGLIEAVLKHELFSRVLACFRSSTVLIDACKNEKKDVIKWLLTMGIDSCIKDEFGMTALMCAAEKPNLMFVVRHYVENDDINCLNTQDMNGENVLYHALYNKNTFTELLKSNIDINQLNNNHESLLLYCCKYDIYEPIPLIVKVNGVNSNITDNEERTAVMYLAEKARNEEISYFHKLNNNNFNYINKKNESVLSLAIKNMYSLKSSHDPDRFCQYISIITMLNNLGCNLNLPIDIDENTAIMVFMIIPDYHALNYFLKYGNKIDLSIKNRFGENASSLFFKCVNDSSLYPFIINNPTFDYEYIDSNNRNTMLILGSLIQPQLVDDVLENNINLINEVNNKNENALIIAIKNDDKKSVDKLLQCGINVNQQDCYGNTALYYAVDIKNINFINSLMLSHADINIKNMEGKSPLNRAHELGEKTIIKILNNPDSINKNDIYPTEKNAAYLKYKNEMDEYLYPCIQNNYSKFKMSNTIEKIAKTIYDSSYQKKSSNYR